MTEPAGVVKVEAVDDRARWRVAEVSSWLRVNLSKTGAIAWAGGRQNYPSALPQDTAQLAKRCALVGNMEEHVVGHGAVVGPIG
jgi:hypothetical protein